MFSLAELAKTLKGCAINSSISDEEFLNALLGPFVTAGRVKAREGKEFWLDKSRTSRILNGHCDVPIFLRKVLARYGLEDAVADGMTSFVQDTLDPALEEYSSIK